jgi:hypothetical protein
MWFLNIENLFPLKDEAPKYGQEAPDARTRSYKSALKSSKGGTWKSINTDQEPLIFIFQSCDLLAQSC